MMKLNSRSIEPSTPVTLRFGVFFDGTGNNQSNAMPMQAGGGKGASYGNALSNVALLHALYAADGADTDGPMVYLKLYVEGVGTLAGEADDMYASATGRGRTGAEARVAEALASIAEQLRGWRQAHPLAALERVEFDVFGFSRGAAAARHLANLLHEGADKQLPVACDVAINFIGLFDTVAAIIAPLQGDLDPADDRHGGLRLGLGAGIARQVVQLVAGDEQRHNFPLVRSGHDIELPGVHSNIGGGYPQSTQEQVLLCKPQSQRVPLAMRAEQTRVYAAVSALLASAFGELGAPRPWVQTWEAPIAGGRPGEAQKQVYAAVYREREVAGQLSRVYLSVMRELAVKAGVPFAPLGEQAEHRLPDELLEISRKLHAFALGECEQPGLTEAEQRLLRDRYVHASANWNALKGLRNSVLDVLFVNRPSAGGRVVHVNPVA
ncbi:T6SS phospholipase effector Tle1-like catalytic domain-containing protein [Pseudomonas sp. TWI929]|uniref:T6SS phospholipase effector Tle1-like catalytic domain-containing protein n=1 Tax=Pseudomonas sp. TWI929 TaxID=3136795 RepID=UPI00320AFDC1